MWDATTEIARTISGNAPLAIKAAKITIAQVLKDPAERDMGAIKQIGTDCMDSEDFREGRRAFMEKRKPQFRGQVAWPKRGTSEQVMLKAEMRS